MFGDASVLLDNPDLVANTWLNFASAFWFFVTPQPPKPSMLEIIAEEWEPNSLDLTSKKISATENISVNVNLRFIHCITIITKRKVLKVAISRAKD